MRLRIWWARRRARVASKHCADYYTWIKATVNGVDFGRYEKGKRIQ